MNVNYTFGNVARCIRAAAKMEKVVRVEMLSDKKNCENLSEESYK